MAKKNKGPKENAENTEQQDEAARAQLRDLVLSAGAVLDDLSTPAQPTEIEWNKETAGLDIVDEPASRFEELAHRVAETVNNRHGEDEIPETEPVIEASIGEEPIEKIETDEIEMEIEAAGADAQGELEPDSESEIETEGEIEPADGAVALASLDESSSTDGMEQMGFLAAGDTHEEGAEEIQAEEIQAEEPEQPAEFIEADHVISIIESLLFSTDKPVSVTTIKQIFKGSNIRTKDITRALETLASEYASATRGVTLEEINGGYQLRTKSDNADYLRRLAKIRPFRLSGPALEVMSIVAYKQPITKHEIDEIRGVESGHLLRALMERGLVHFEGKSELPGKPMTYGSTRKFLETFGLRNIKELPTLSEIDELLPEGIGQEEEEKETLSDITESMSQHVASSYSEGEEELSKINESLQSIDTTTEFFEQEKVRERERRDRERAQDIRERIVLGDAVETKDQRWLDRYEAKLAAASAPQPEPGAEGVVVDASVAGEVDPEADRAEFAGQLESLSDEMTEIDPSMMASESDDDIDLDDLSGDLEWNEDVESDPESEKDA